MKYPESMIRITQCIRWNGPEGFGAYMISIRVRGAPASHICAVRRAPELLMPFDGMRPAL
jgi:hypothetical protein